jgi:hypothetical protein
MQVLTAQQKRFGLVDITANRISLPIKAVQALGGNFVIRANFVHELDQMAAGD